MQKNRNLLAAVRRCKFFFLMFVVVVWESIPIGSTAISFRIFVFYVPNAYISASVSVCVCVCVLYLFALSFVVSRHPFKKETSIRAATSRIA